MYQQINKEAFNRVVTIANRHGITTDYLQLKSITEAGAKKIIKEKQLVNTIDGFGNSKFVKVGDVVPTFVLNFMEIPSLNVLIREALKEDTANWWTSKYYEKWKNKTLEQFKASFEGVQYEAFVTYCEEYVQKYGIKHFEIVYEKSALVKSGAPTDLDNVFKSVIDLFVKETNKHLQELKIDDAHFNKIVGQKIEAVNKPYNTIYVRFY